MSIAPIIGILIQSLVALLVIGALIAARRDPNPELAEGGSRIVDWGAFVAIIILSISVLFVPPHNFEPFKISDALEYLTAGMALAKDRYLMTLDGISHPFRFQPFFPTLFVAPTLAIDSSGDSSTLFVTAYGVIAIAFAFIIGKRLAAFWGGVGAALATLILPEFWYFGRVVMTDVPGATIALLAALYFDRFSRRESHTLKNLAVIGVIGGIATAIRITGSLTVAPFILAFLVSPRGVRRLTGFVLLITPTVAVLGVGMIADLLTFGSPIRSGYHYWMSVPYDFPNLTFSLNYAAENVMTLTRILPPLAVVALFPIVRWILRRRGIVLGIDLLALKNFENYTLLIGLPLVAFYLPYFYDTPRFYLPLAVLLTALSGALLGSIVALRNPPRALFGAILLFASVLVAGVRLNSANPAAQSISAVSYLSAGIPPNSTVISGLNPLYVERRVIWGTERVLVPISRRVEYASKVVSRKRIASPNPLPNGPFDHRAEGARAGGAKDAYPMVALENLAEISRLVGGGLPVYLETTALTEDERKVIEERFLLSEAHPGVQRLSPKSAVDSPT